ncbi:cupin domain-containing protein [Kitasatospora sp. NPDC058965]|uniref:cupin domain-containing protein n=1 Tax=Kitasatospora sp. NPDC058965 TaxID=3346682 RepID=UPI003693C7D7
MAVIRTVTIAPGSDTGWHYHPAQVEAVLMAGVLTRVLEDGTVEITRPGQTLVELPEQVHIGYNLGSEPVVILANYQVAEGCQLAFPATPPAAGLAAVAELVGLPVQRRGGRQWLAAG